MNTMIFALKGIAAYTTHARQLGCSDPEVDRITHAALCMEYYSYERFTIPLERGEKELIMDFYLPCK
ncbi:hypothetical protein PAENI_24740 [Paenibacillus sp. B2(2019)]|nr:hypothetical protein PAENI_24740 [Paenibacillus sp. B2(2019)]